MRNGRRAGSLVDDDVRSSLDLLDGVIGEFDDGLTSSAESEVNHPRHSRNDINRYTDEEDEVKADFRSSRLSINDQIDDIFSQLTEEIYADEKTTNKVEVRQKSPTRNRFDPLPIPPTSKTHPPPIDRKKKPTSRNDNSANYKTQNTLTNDRPRPRQAQTDRQNFSLPQKYNRSDGVHGEVILYEDHNDTIRTNEKVVVDVHKNGDYVRQHPPPKPQKQKIHLKQSSIERNREAGKNNQQRKRDVTSQEHAVIQELREKVGDKQGKISKFSKSNKRSQSQQPERDRSEGNSNTRPQRNNYEDDRNSRDGNRRENRRYNSHSATRQLSPNSSVSQKSNPYESIHDSDSTRTGRQPNGSNRPSSKGSGDRRSQTKGNHQNRENYRRSRSLGPLENRENTSSQQRSRSRGPAQDYLNPSPEGYEADRSISRHRSQNREDTQHRTRDNANDRTRSKSRGRRDDEIRDRYRDQTNNLHQPRSRGPVEDISRRSRSHGRSPTRRYGFEDTKNKLIPPSPAEAQETIAKMLPRYPHGIPPERQRSMIDLRMSDEVKKSQRRSMAVGPLEDLPPHLRNHLMPAALKNSNNRTQIPSYIDEQLRFQHQMNIEAQRDQLLQRGFPVSHPLVSGEIPLHPELLGQLHFEIPSRTTLPLGPEDFRRFLPEMRRNGMQSAFPMGNSELAQMPTDLNDKSNKVVRQMSKKEQSFVSLPHKDAKKKDKQDNRSRSTDSQENKPRPFSMFQGGQGWLNSGFVKREGGADESKARQSQHDQQWFMKEREDLKSMPPIIMTDDFDKARKPSRNDKNRSSFGMILKDKFQKNPNMYFPDTRTPSKSPEFMETRNSKNDSLSDTDTLIHNMSEGSFEKGSTLSGGHSIGSNKSSRSSGKSSASHDSMNGTPRMIRRTDSITTPKEPINTSFIIPTNPSVILNKKTIRNYVPPESTNMLRNFEGNRQGLSPSKGYSKNQEPERGRERKTNEKKPETNLERKSSMEKLIDDFHRNLPPPAKNNEASIPFSDGDSMFSGSHLEHSLNSLSDKHSREKAFKIGTVNSQTSHWSVASSVASFDYHSVNSIDKSKKMSKSNNDLPSKRKTHDQLHNLPSLNEDDISPHGVRIPPEGASAESPENSVHRKKEKHDSEGNEDARKKTNSNMSHAQDAVSDLMKSSENDDELLMLRKLISEGRISGLNEKPPPFIPPTPPSKTSSNKKTEGQSPKTPSKQNQPRQYTQATKSGDRPRKNREAPKPPTQEFKSPPPTSEIKFISGRRINSVESINDDQSIPTRRSAKREPRSEGVQRSTSMHMPRDNSREESTKDAALAQLIADSTEKKFKINSLFKGMWKKKHYSFDLS